MLSKSTLLITVSGRKSGKLYTLPANYIREGDILWITSQRDRTWWRNLQGGVPVTIVLQGKTRLARGLAIEEPGQVAESLAAYLRLAPGLARYFDVRLDAGGQPLTEDIAKAADQRVVVRIDLVK
jgi:hypothetical protein